MNAGIVAQFALATVLPALATTLLLSIKDRLTAKVSPAVWQLICGLVFGLVAVFGTEFGIATHDATMNVRDAAPIAAGLLFGGPAGIVAGIIGGVERWFAALWGRGMFTRLACSLATCLAGFYAAMLHRYVFERRRPGLPLACATGMVAEVLHLMLVFITCTHDTAEAFVIARACTIPMVSCNGIAVALATYVAARASGEWTRERSDVPDLSHVVRTHLLGVTVVGFALSLVFTALVQDSVSRIEATRLLTLALEDVETDIGDASDDNLLAIAHRAVIAIPDIPSALQEEIDWLVEQFTLAEVNVIDKRGIIVASSNPRLVGFNMASGEQSAAFLTLLELGTKPYLTQDLQPTAHDPSVWRKYAAARIDGGFIQVGYDVDQFMSALANEIYGSVRNRRVGQSGSLVVIAPDGSIAAMRAGIALSQDDADYLIAACAGVDENSLFTCEYCGEPVNAAYRLVEGYRVIALQPQEEAEMARDLSVLIMTYMEVLIFAMLFIAVYMLIRNEVVQSIWQVNATLGKITDGDLEAEVSVQKNAEFVSLSNDINAMVLSLRDAISAEAARIDQELEYARTIQESALPRTFPPFPEVEAFDIYAGMDPAREVGGDFYDFFRIDDQTIGLLVADVSGKGIPASLFMMAAKAEISNYMTSGMGIADAIQSANWHLCQGNEAGMFVTVWAATLNYQTGELTYVNAGHNPPLLRHNGSWEWLRQKGGLFLGSFETARYRSATLTLAPGDQLFVYSDGVNEAFSANDEQYGNDRLHDFLARHAQFHPRPLIDALHASLAHWAEGAEQSDDITMLALEYGVAPQATASLTVPATLDQFDRVIESIHGVLHGRSCPITTQNQIDIVLEELFVNVCNYAYQDADEVGTVTIEYVYNTNPNALTVSLSDHGAPFDPLAREDPSLPTSADDIRVGGLGILMVKHMTDDLSYLRDEGRNVVVFVKGW